MFADEEEPLGGGDSLLHEAQFNEPNNQESMLADALKPEKDPMSNVIPGRIFLQLSLQCLVDSLDRFSPSISGKCDNYSLKLWVSKMYTKTSILTFYFGIFSGTIEELGN